MNTSGATGVNNTVLLRVISQPYNDRMLTKYLISIALIESYYTALVVKQYRGQCHVIAIYRAEDLPTLYRQARLYINYRTIIIATVDYRDVLHKSIELPGRWQEHMIVEHLQQHAERYFSCPSTELAIDFQSHYLPTGDTQIETIAAKKTVLDNLQQQYLAAGFRLQGITVTAIELAKLLPYYHDNTVLLLMLHQNQCHCYVSQQGLLLECREQAIDSHFTSFTLDTLVAIITNYLVKLKQRTVLIDQVVLAGTVNNLSAYSKQLKNSCNIPIQLATPTPIPNWHWPDKLSAAFPSLLAHCACLLGAKI